MKTLDIIIKSFGYIIAGFLPGWILFLPTSILTYTFGRKDDEEDSFEMIKINFGWMLLSIVCWGSLIFLSV